MAGRRKRSEFGDVNDGGVATLEVAMTAVDAIAKLQESGTPRNDLRRLDPWLKDNPDSSAIDLYEHVEPLGILKPGTVRKLGKIAHGADFEPETFMDEGVADKLAKLQAANDRLSDRVAELEAEKLTLIHRARYVEEQKEDLSKQVQYLRIGRSAEELAKLDEVMK